jgi:MoxR-like ATPase
VYALPEAQRDRFLMKVVVGYPSPNEELEIVRRMGARPPEPRRVISTERLLELQDLADAVYVDSAVAQYAVDLVMATREPALRGLPELAGLLEFGVSPRATLGLVASARALALLRGRDYATPQDVFDVALDVLRHRIVLSYEALAQGRSADDILKRMLAVVPAASLTPREHREPGEPREPVDPVSIGTPPPPPPPPQPRPEPQPSPTTAGPGPAPSSGA